MAENPDYANVFPLVRVAAYGDRRFVFTLGNCKILRKHASQSSGWRPFEARTLTLYTTFTFALNTSSNMSTHFFSVSDIATTISVSFTILKLCVPYVLPHHRHCHHHHLLQKDASGRWTYSRSRTTSLLKVRKSGRSILKRIVKAPHQLKGLKREGISVKTGGENTIFEACTVS